MGAKVPITDSDLNTSSVTRPPALRITKASPFCRPRKSVGSTRASEQGTTKRVRLERMRCAVAGQ